MRTTFLALTVGLVIGASTLAACRSSSGDDGSNTDGGSGTIDAPAGGVTIQMVQNASMPAGTPVQLYGKVVTAIDTFGTRTGNVWVEEPTGGVQSGVLVFGVGSAALASIAVGDLVNVTGAMKEEYVGSGDTSGNSDTELGPMSSGTLAMTKAGVGTVPPPVTVDALTIGMMAGSARSAAWAQYLGVLVTVSNVSELGAPKSYGSGGSDQHEFDITGDLVVEDELAPFASSGLTRATCLGSVTGIVDYFFNYNLIPRATADITTGGTGCPAAETSCTDNIDNDGNGFTDCLDDNCITTSSATCTSTSTIDVFDAAFDAAPAAPVLPTGVGSNNAFTLANVYVTAITAGSGGSFWVSESVAAGSNKGLYVFNSGTTLTGTTTIAVGKKVTLIGTLELYKDSLTNGELEFNLLGGSVANDAAATITPVTGVTAATLDAATGNPYIGSLVTIPNVAVTTAGVAGTNHGIGALKSAGTAFEATGDLTLAPAVGCYASMTGIWIYDAFTQVYGFEITTVGASQAAGSCT